MNADDIRCFAPSFKGLQGLVDTCVKFALKHNIVFNCSKTKAMFFPCKRFKTTDHNLTVNDQLVSWQRWSPRGRPWPRGHILKSLALVSKVKSKALASKPQVLENCLVLGSRTTLFFEPLKCCWKTPRNLAENLRTPFFVFRNWSIGVAKWGSPGPPIEISPMTKM